MSARDACHGAGDSDYGDVFSTRCAMSDHGSARTSVGACRIKNFPERAYRQLLMDRLKAPLSRATGGRVRLHLGNRVRSENVQLSVGPTLHAGFSRCDQFRVRTGYFVASSEFERLLK